MHEKGGPFLLGVTGGVATGKTAVAAMLEELGARTIDFDTLCRLVVEPGRPAWGEIVDYFGEQVLLEDETLDRKKLAEIVFRDAAKRKKLESFIHPRAGEEYAKIVHDFASREPNAIVQVVVPLLFEAKMERLFDKVLLVYLPEEMQIDRLMTRDGVSREMAARMLASQRPIDEKKQYADFIVDNSGSFEQTRKQVEEIWHKLQRARKTIP
jgi:dephospho-CoA kinase